jgi:hypothetical protein
VGIWVSGLLASGLIGGFVGSIFDNPYSYSHDSVFLAAIAGMLVFTCARLWLAKSKQMAFWSKKSTRPEPSENPFRARNPEAFDKGAEINKCARELRRIAMSTQSTEAEAITALQTALGGEIAATVLRRNPTFSPDQNLHALDQVLDGVARKRSNRATIQGSDEPYCQ